MFNRRVLAGIQNGCIARIQTSTYVAPVRFLPTTALVAPSPEPGSAWGTFDALCFVVIWLFSIFTGFAIIAVAAERAVSAALARRFVIRR